MNLVNFRQCAKMVVFGVDLNKFLKNYRPQLFLFLEPESLGKKKTEKINARDGNPEHTFTCILPLTSVNLTFDIRHYF
jgi:hypothetical protein